MARFVRGDVVIVPFPFSSATEFKRRPAVILASWPYADSTDYLLCMITSQPAVFGAALELEPGHFSEGSLPVRSFARPCYMFTADEALISSRRARLTNAAMQSVLDSIVALLQSS